MTEKETSIFVSNFFSLNVSRAERRSGEKMRTHLGRDVFVRGSSDGRLDEARYDGQIEYVGQVPRHGYDRDFHFGYSHLRGREKRQSQDGWFWSAGRWDGQSKKGHSRV